MKKPVQHGLPIKTATRSDSFPLLNLSASDNRKDVSLVPSLDLWEKWEFVHQP